MNNSSLIKVQVDEIKADKKTIKERRLIYQKIKPFMDAYGLQPERFEIKGRSVVFKSNNSTNTSHLSKSGITVKSSTTSKVKKISVQMKKQLPQRKIISPMDYQDLPISQKYAHLFAEIQSNQDSSKYISAIQQSAIPEEAEDVTDHSVVKKQVQQEIDELDQQVFIINRIKQQKLQELQLLENKISELQHLENNIVSNRQFVIKQPTLRQKKDKAASLIQAHVKRRIDQARYREWQQRKAEKITKLIKIQQWWKYLIKKKKRGTRYILTHVNRQIRILDGHTFLVVSDYSHYLNRIRILFVERLGVLKQDFRFYLNEENCIDILREGMVEQSFEFNNLIDLLTISLLKVLKIDCNKIIVDISLENQVDVPRLMLLINIKIDHMSGNQYQILIEQAQRQENHNLESNFQDEEDHKKDNSDQSNTMAIRKKLEEIRQGEINQETELNMELQIVKSNQEVDGKFNIEACNQKQEQIILTTVGKSHTSNQNEEIKSVSNKGKPNDSEEQIQSIQNSGKVPEKENCKLQNTIQLESTYNQCDNLLEVQENSYQQMTTKEECHSVKVEKEQLHSEEIIIQGHQVVTTFENCQFQDKIIKEENDNTESGREQVVQYEQVIEEVENRDKVQLMEIKNFEEQIDTVQDKIIITSFPNEADIEEQKENHEEDPRKLMEGQDQLIDKQEKPEIQLHSDNQNIGQQQLSSQLPDSFLTREQVPLLQIPSPDIQLLKSCTSNFDPPLQFQETNKLLNSNDLLVKSENQVFSVFKPNEIDATLLLQSEEFNFPIPFNLKSSHERKTSQDKLQEVPEPESPQARSRAQSELRKSQTDEIFKQSLGTTFKVTFSSEFRASQSGFFLSQPFDITVRQLDSLQYSMEDSQEYEPIYITTIYLADDEIDVYQINDKLRFKDKKEQYSPYDYQIQTIAQSNCDYINNNLHVYIIENCIKCLEGCTVIRIQRFLKTYGFIKSCILFYNNKQYLATLYKSCLRIKIIIYLDEVLDKEIILEHLSCKNRQLIQKYFSEICPRLLFAESNYEVLILGFVKLLDAN